MADQSAFAQRRGPRGGGGGGGGAPGAAESGGARSESSVKPYDDVIPATAETKRGLFITHRVGDELFYEIPVDAFGKEMVWVVSIAQTTEGASLAGEAVIDRVVRWELDGERVLLRDVKYGMRAETKDPIASAVQASNLAPILAVYPVAAWGKDKAPVIKVTDLFRRDVDEFSARETLGAGSMDRDRSFIQSCKSFPRNVEVRVLATFAPGRAAEGAAATPRRFGGGGPRGTVTAVIHHSMVKLPDVPMQPRKGDERVGFFSVGFTDYADLDHHAVEQVRYITRWRLEKENPEEEISDVREPIVFYVGREVPEKWKPFVKAGIEAWQPAFEAAGFRGAILAKDPPDPRDDPDWDAEDARYSSIRWLPSETENAYGPHVHDPRTGEILEADVRMFHNVMKLARDWYFVQASACDERAQKLPMPDDLEGELIQFVVTHEVGHSLGLPHNFKASSSYTVDQLRDPEWTKKNGTAPSIMDYARFNYVAQPGDGAGLLPRVGPYDYYAINWGYRQFAQGADEKAELEKLCQLQIEEPMYRFGDGRDPTAQSEDLTGDAVEATRLGALNLKRITGFLVKACCEPGRDYELLANMYDAVLAQWSREMGHVVSYVGGVEEVNLWFGDANQRYYAVSGSDQREAVKFLIEQVIGMPPEFMPADVVQRLSGDGVRSRLLSHQSRVLGQLVSARRLDAMRSEIVQQAARQMRDDEFDRAVKALRERREKERAATRAAEEAQRNRTPPQPADPARP